MLAEPQAFGPTSPLSPEGGTSPVPLTHSASLLQIRLKCCGHVSSPTSTLLGPGTPATSLSPACIDGIDACLERHRQVAPVYLFRDAHDPGLLKFATIPGYDCLLVSLADNLRALLQQSSGFDADVRMVMSVLPATPPSLVEECGQNW